MMDDKDTAWAGPIDSVEQLEDALLRRYVEDLEAKVAEEDGPEWLDCVRANRSRIEAAMRPMVEKDAAVIWARHLASEERLS